MKQWRGRIVLGAIAALVIVFLVMLFRPQVPSDRIPDYQISSQLPANQVDYYPLQQNLDGAYYRPLGEWLGRLILPTVAETKATPGDWVWLELYQAPSIQQGLVGQKLRLTWQSNADLEKYLRLVTTDVNFTPAALNSERRGNLLPDRLNGRSQVGPLQSLAGARPVDDVLVRFPRAQVNIPAGNRAEIKLPTMPEMVTGRYQALVKIIGPDPKADPSTVPKDCPGSQPCATDLMLVQHYNAISKQFDGPQETIRIPQQPRLNGDRFMSTPRDLATVAVGRAGWYIYGAQGQDGLFTVQSLQPRSLVQLQPDEQIFRLGPGRDYISQQNWHHTPARKGTAQKVLLDPRSDSPEVALGQWQEGDRLLGMHLFGGIGGKLGEKTMLGTVTGHFAFSLPKIVRDPFTDELQWEIPYYQVYAHNPQGIIAGSQTWENYAGNLQRGWVQSRPFADVMVKLDLLQDYNFGEVVLSPLDELQKQLQIMMARYRTGDGTGYAGVSPAASCVQDSNQALYLAIVGLQQKVENSPEILSWLDQHPSSPESQRFQRLKQLGDRLLAMLKPRGVTREDWQNNAATLAGLDPDNPTNQYDFIQDNTLVNALLSWQSMLPRVNQDILNQIFLEQGAQLWFMRPNQVGGAMPEILPLAPTSIFGDVPVFSALARRTLGAIVLLPKPQDWQFFGIAVVVYGAIAIPLGMKFGLLQWQWWEQSLGGSVKSILALFFLPALGEELVFRVMLLPYPTELNLFWPTLGAMALSLVLFLIYHPLNALLFYPRGRNLFFQPIFLALTGLLGIVTTALYWYSGSLWLITIFHWLVVTVWLMALGGYGKLAHQEAKR
ncbi:CPBP family intramembrane metalloprotease [Synechocystis sp. FACHB-383]|uniref:CPBP family glutamic-type intramembrane protease n=1 Tax=Synechocystis sp. FACHB-383 TaxID=2692864 RepID=UPI0016888C16|nr:CPBP family glutamic-type intramembrane protease [Synechocystis sp. FACHB-383]MBD2654326.1 CPBP family intramembrane metalloprotease [Synechocystis sp. FACHB-383]